MNEPAASPSTPPIPAKRRGCFGLALKTVLGCCAFAVGSIVAILLLLPTLLQGWARSASEAVFNERFHGSLTVRDLSLSWKSPQKITDAVLLDPEKREVARVTAELPSILDLLRSGSTRRLRIDVDADLVADDSGMVNLQRAIAPRQPTPQRKAEDEASDTDPLSILSTLDAELVVTSRRLAWSDAETRRAGKPFEVRGLSVMVRAKPGSPLTVHAAGEVVSDTPGALEVDATVHGPIESGKAWPFGEVDAKVRMEGFSTPMVDGIAGLGGKLTEVLGPRFDLRIAAAGVTPQKGGLEVGLASERSSLDFSGSFEGGFLRSRDGSPVRLTLGVPRGFATDAIAPTLPPGVQVTWEESEKPWTLTVSNLELPIPDAGALGVQGLTKTFEHLTCDVDVDLPVNVALESPETKSAGVRASVKGMKASVHTAKGESLVVRAEATLDTGSAGRFAAEATIPDPWKSLTAGSIPAFDASVRLTGLSTPAIDALAGQGGRVAEALGPSIAVNVDVRAGGSDARSVVAAVESPRMKLSLRGTGDAATWLRCDGDEGLDLAWDPPGGFIDRQSAPFLPAGGRLAAAPGKVEIRGRGIVVPASTTKDADLMKSVAFTLKLKLPGATWSGAEGGPGLPPIAIDGIEVAAAVTPGGNLTANLRTGLAGGAGGRISLDAIGQDVLGKSPKLDAKLGLDGLATATIDGFAGQKDLLAGALGPSLTATCTVHVEGSAVAGKVEATSQAMNFWLAGRLDGEQVVAKGEEGLHLTLNPEAAWLSRRLGPALPPGASLSLTDPARPLEIDVRDLTLSLQKDAEAALPALLQSLACKLGVRVGGLRYADTRAKSPGSELAVRDLDLAVEIAPKKPLQSKLTAVVDAGKDLGQGNLAANLSLPDPWYFLSPEAAAIPPVDADIRLAGLPCASLDTLCGRPGLLSGLFGSTADLAVRAQVANADSGTFSAELTSPNAKVSAAAKLEKGMLASSSKPAVEVEATLTQAWLDQQAGPLLPAGARLSIPDGKGSLRLSVKDLRFPVPQGPVSPEALSVTSLHLSASLPDLAYADPKTAAANAPAVVRGLALEAEIAPGKAPVAKLSAKVESQPPGELSADVRALDPLTALAAENGLDRFHIAADVKAKALPTGLVDGLAGQGGLLVDMLGPRFDLAVHTDSISKSDGTFTASLESEKATVHCDRGGMKDGILRLEKVQGSKEALLARAPLSPLFSERVVGNLVPALVTFTKPEGSEPVAVAVEDLSVPLDADLSKLDAIVRVNLGDVICHPLPGLAGALGKAGGTTLHVSEIRVPIQKGVASYDGLPLPIGGKSYPLKGTFSLVDKSFKMETELPLSVLGKGVSGQLDGLRGVIDGNTMIPLEIRGTWKSPKLGVGDKFLKKLAEDALKMQGGSLLEGLLKKKK